MNAHVKESAAFVKFRLGADAKTAVILGSGLGALAKDIAEKKELPYRDIPHFPQETVSGHEGTLIGGFLSGKEVLVMNGRFHYYQGYSMAEVTYPLYVLRESGVENLIVSNAAGGINERFHPGTLMILKDFINFFGTNPLIGPRMDDEGPQFPDMSRPFSRRLTDLARKKAQELGVPYTEGVYLGTTGPSYETAAEIRMMRILGADAVGMSTVPEIIAGNYLKMEILGISCITNMATGLASGPHAHEKVLEEARKAEGDFCRWVKEIIGEI
ncbi:MAG: purine-nucleoside phosphorylase [Fusobacteriaceae bacterium]|jgi:purine-nucleoside phosphorylase|nr:purine-nucleoside phosphorylase [Fusobacteriaceae bacterium]